MAETKCKKCGGTFDVVVDLCDDCARLEKIVTLQNYMKKIDNGWNSGHIFQMEIILGELIEEYNEVRDSRIETEEKNVRTRS